MKPLKNLSTIEEYFELSLALCCWRELERKGAQESPSCTFYFDYLNYRGTYRSPLKSGPCCAECCTNMQ